MERPSVRYSGPPAPNLGLTRCATLIERIGFTTGGRPGSGQRTVPGGEVTPVSGVDPVLGSLLRLGIGYRLPGSRHQPLFPAGHLTRRTQITLVCSAAPLVAITPRGISGPRPVIGYLAVRGEDDGVTDPDQAWRCHRSVDAEAALMTLGDCSQDAPVAGQFLLCQG